MTALIVSLHLPSLPFNSGLHRNMCVPLISSKLAPKNGTAVLKRWKGYTSPNMVSDVTRLPRSPSDVTSFCHHVTVRPCPSTASVLFVWKETPWIGHYLAVFKDIFQGVLSKTGIIHCVPGFSGHLPSRRRAAHFRSRPSVNCGHSPP